MKPDGEDCGIALEIGICAEYGPAARKSDFANEDVDARHHNSPRPAVIAGLGGRLVV